MTNEKPFLVCVDGPFPYWLLDPPEPSTPIVKHYTSLLCQNVEYLANYNGIRSTVDEAINALQQYNRMMSIPIATQCNRLMKHTEALAAYLANFRSISAVIVPKLHYSMKCFYYDRPPRKQEGEEQLSQITLVTKSVANAASQNACLSKKAEKVAVEIIETMRKKQESCLAIEALHQAIQIMSSFWRTLSEHCEEMRDLSCQIESRASPKIAAEDFETLKKQAICFSARWKAISKTCNMYFNNSNFSHELKCRSESLISLPMNFDELASSLDAHFEDLYFKLLKEDYEMQEEVAIYSTWMKPKINADGVQCHRTAEEAIEQIKQGNGKEAEPKLERIKHQSKGLIAVTHLIAKRLESLQKYLKCQQELLMKKIEKLEEEEKQKLAEISDLKKKIDKELGNICECKKLQDSAEINYQHALEKQQAAEKKIKKMSKWWWIPVKHQQDFSINSYIQQWMAAHVENNKQIVTEEAAKINKYREKQRQIENSIMNARKQKASLENYQDKLHSHIEKSKQQEEERFKMFSEMKQCTGDLIETTFYWNEVIVAAEHAHDRTVKFENLVRKANEKINPAKALQSRGSQSFSRTFIDAWTIINDIVQEAPQRDVVFDFECTLCTKECKGLPMPVDDVDIVCNTCAKKYI